MDEMTIQRAGRQQNLLAWSQRVADCRSSGLSVNRWCAEHDIKPKTYDAQLVGNTSKLVKKALRRQKKGELASIKNIK